MVPYALDCPNWQYKIVKSLTPQSWRQTRDILIKAGLMQTDNQGTRLTVEPLVALRAVRRGTYKNEPIPFPKTWPHAQEVLTIANTTATTKTTATTETTKN
jgi:hypothetical protein